MLIVLVVYAATVPAALGKPFWVGPIDAPVVSAPPPLADGMTNEQRTAALLAIARAAAAPTPPPPPSSPLYVRIHGPWAIGCIAIGAGLLAAGRRVGHRHW